LFDLLLLDLRSPGNFPLSGHVLLHELKAFILLAKTRELIFNDRFDFSHSLAADPLGYRCLGVAARVDVECLELWCPW
jgi:hypothetical protein